MSDNIDMTVTGGAFAAVRVGGWHHLGKVSDVQLSTLELLQMGGCDFPIHRGVIKIDELVETAEGFPPVRYQAEDERMTAIYRVHPETGEAQILGTASAKYPLWSPKDTFVGFGDNVLKYLGQPVKASTAGALDGGRQVFMGFELPQDIRLGSDEVIQLWLLVHTSFDQSAITRAAITPIRPVCANTVQAGISAALSTFTVKKTSRADIQAAQAQAALQLIPDYMEAYTARAQALLDTEVTKRKFIEIITDLWGPGEDARKQSVDIWQTKANTLIDLFENADTQAGIRHTAWGAYNAVVERQDWLSDVAPGTAPEDADAVRFARSVGITDGRKIAQPKTDFLDRLLALV